jgi:hypothetical protein
MFARIKMIGAHIARALSILKRANIRHRLRPMRKILFATALCASTVFAQTQQPSFRVQFVPPPELAKPNRPATSAEGAYTLSAVVTGVNGASKQPWSVTIPVRSYVIKAPRDSASGNSTGRRAYKPVRFSFHKSALSLQFGAAIAREDKIRSVKFDFHPVTSAPSTSVVVHGLDHASLEVVDEYVEATFPTYEKITWTWLEGQKTQTDEWTVPPPK